jgi:hypothetical protein
MHALKQKILPAAVVFGRSAQFFFKHAILLTKDDLAAAAVHIGWKGKTHARGVIENSGNKGKTGCCSPQNVGSDGVADQLAPARRQPFGLWRACLVAGGRGYHTCHHRAQLQSPGLEK